MTKKSIVSVSLFLLLTLTVGPLFAQPSAGPQDMMGPSVQMIRMFYTNDVFNKKFAVTQEQAQQLDVFLEEHEKLVDQVRERFRGRVPTAKVQEELFKESQEIRNKLMEGLKKILTPEQMDQIEIFIFQLFGGFNSPALRYEIFKVLGFSEEQLAKVKTLNEERIGKLREEVAKMREDAQKMQGKSPAEQQQFLVPFRRKGAELAREYGMKIREELTLEQRGQVDKWDLEAPPFKAEFRRILSPSPR